MSSRIERHSVPPGFSTKATAWRRLIGGEIAALMPLPPFDGTQECVGDERFTAEEQHDAVTLDELRDVCTSCRFLLHCRDYALAHERYNFHAAMTPNERARMRRQARIQIVDRYASTLYGLDEGRGYASA